MKYTQNEKLNQLDFSTMVVGVDVGSEFHYARAFDYRGIELSGVFKISNDAVGFEAFEKWSHELMMKHDKSKLIVGMEPTGHYWFNFGYSLKENNRKVVLVNPMHVKRSKEFDDNNPTKNDRKDPKTIAMLVKDGRYLEPYMPEGVFRELRISMETRERYIKHMTVINNKVQRWLSIYFPEFKTVFKDWSGQGAMIALKSFATPEKVIAKGIEAIANEWKSQIKRAVGTKHAVRLMKAAETSVGIKEGLRAAEYDLLSLIEEYEFVTKKLEATLSLIEELLQQVPNITELLAIKGIGVVTVAGFIAEVGNISRFEHPKQIQKLAGLNLKENSSGKHKGKTTLSKRGRKRLRRLLFQAVMILVAKNAEFRQLHLYYTNRIKNPLKKKQSIMAISCKLIRVFYTLLTKGTPYDGEKMIRDIKRIEPKAA
ncbi:IS110 family transposase [Pseudobacteroides cellulosolvens]|jgi:transposase|uniref:Transposase IS111A/IS1328/IS1533 n=1 Tax=Pseudobacteroides cellulosolvens ATCC 35603 = DSM 2933 TaxID=398512 RepID=A0A0L6JJ54_9FIRM|nr:IS110 family transposase [Pseudobacteroides cellulosolvens]KNY25703.1 transposase IS111A/IS1328/IS1533 [Pseudobacteroides cellulosolvens ATCC 35603 = DSM 2933]KNY26925.1 transposase IS111A/IS1328/IS1533 [Pseudobacteroides cellulosolvens ATCC 35603 = DSM 2933]